MTTICNPYVILNYYSELIPLAQVMLNNITKKYNPAISYNYIGVKVFNNLECKIDTNNNNPKCNIDFNKCYLKLTVSPNTSVILYTTKGNMMITYNGTHNPEISIRNVGIINAISVTCFDDAAKQQYKNINFCGSSSFAYTYMKYYFTKVLTDKFSGTTDNLIIPNNTVNTTSYSFDLSIKENSLISLQDAHGSKSPTSPYNLKIYNLTTVPTIINISNAGIIKKINGYNISLDASCFNKIILEPYAKIVSTKTKLINGKHRYFWLIVFIIFLFLYLVFNK